MEFMCNMIKLMQWSSIGCVLMVVISSCSVMVEEEGA